MSATPKATTPKATPAKGATTPSAAPTKKADAPVGAPKAPVKGHQTSSRAAVRAAGRASRPKQGVPQEAPSNKSRRAANTQGHLRRSGRGDFAASKTARVDPYAIILHPMVTEKSMGQMDRHNSLEFLVRRTATKHQIKSAVAQLFDAEVAKVNTRITREGKRATVKFGGETSAEDIGQRIGVF